MSGVVPVTGGCLCGAVRWQADAAPEWVATCHCRKCRKALGGIFGVFAAFPLDTFRYTKGVPRYYHSSAWAKRGFCADCGTSLDFWLIDDQVPAITLGSFDRPEDWPPDLYHTGIEGKVTWHKIADDLPQQTSDASVYVKEAKAKVAAGKSWT